MGIAASTGKSGSDELFSPRIKIFKKGETIILDSEPLKDIGIGTVRYRHETPLDEITGNSINVQKGYFFHPNLDDYSEISNLQNENKCKFIKVEQGPKKSHNKEITYVTGIGFDGNQQTLPPTLYNKAFKFGHKYYKIKLADESHTNKETVSESLLLEMAGEDNISSVKREISGRNFYPVAILHIMEQEDCELSDTKTLSEMFGNEKEKHNIQIISLN